MSEQSIRRSKKRRSSSRGQSSSQHLPQELQDTSDSDFEDDAAGPSSGNQPVVRRMRSSGDSVVGELASIRQSLSRLQSTGLPAGLRRHLQDAFKCAICLDVPLTPPIIFSHCCNRIIGCQQCVQRWQEEDQTLLGPICPLCRQSAQGTTEVLRGLDDFIEEIRPYLNNN